MIQLGRVPGGVGGWLTYQLLLSSSLGLDQFKKQYQETHNIDACWYYILLLIMLVLNISRHLCFHSCVWFHSLLLSLIFVCRYCVFVTHVYCQSFVFVTLFCLSIFCDCQSCVFVTKLQKVEHLCVMGIIQSMVCVEAPKTYAESAMRIKYHLYILY